MPELTLDAVTDLTRTLASRTGDQVTNRMNSLLPGRDTRPARGNRMQAGKRGRKQEKQAGNGLDAGELLRRGALIFAGTRLATDWVRRLRGDSERDKRESGINLNLPSLLLPGGSGIAARGAKQAAKVATGPGASGAKAAMKTAKTAGRGWWLFRRARAPQPLRGAQRRMRRGWRWVRAFTIGFATGAIWAYLFAPRRGPGYQQMQQGAQHSA